MHIPPRDPRDRSLFTHPDEQHVLPGYVTMAGVLLFLWTLSNPFAGAFLFAGGIGLVVATRRAASLASCLSRCGGFTLDPPGGVRIAVCDPSVADGGPC